MNFKSLSLARQLILVTVSTSVVALFVVAIGFFLYDGSEFRAQMVRDTTTVAEIIGTNSAGTLAFKEMGKGDAKKTLEALNLKSDINAAVLYDNNNALFADFKRNPSTTIPDNAPPEGSRFAGNSLIVAKRIVQSGELLGTIYIEASMLPLYQRQQQFATMAIGLLLLASLLSYFVITGIVGAVIRPLQVLAETTQRVAVDNDYTLQVDMAATGELRDLIDSFNHMMSEVQKRDSVLQNMNETLEQRVIDRTNALESQRAERQRAELAAEAAESANRVKSAFLANMSHELRTPLNAIIGYSEILVEEATDNDDDSYVPDLQKISGAGKHLLALINDILDLSKIEAGKMDIFVESFEIDSLIKEVTDTINPLMAKKRNTLLLDCDPNLGAMNSDLTKMRQSLFNLLSNASKFTEDGSVTLRVRRNHEIGGDMLVFSVEDTGIGMSAEQMSRLFQAFSQADAGTTRKYGGTGLGLTITRRFCQMLGGDVTVKSELGKGSTFTITLPADLNVAPLSVTEEEDDDAFNENAPIILAIDDEPAARDLLRRHLSKEGFRVETAADGREGIERARALKPVLITLDVIMPRMNGWSVLAELKSDPELVDIPVVMVTMLDERSVGYAMGAVNYLTKPIDKARLLTVVDRFRSKTETNSILIVEDDESTREVTRLFLEKDGWVVFTAENGQVGLDILKTHSPRLILLDLMMPVMDGFAFVEEVGKSDVLKQIPIIVLTAMDLSEEDRHRLDGRVQQVVQKSAFSLEELAKRIADLRSSAGRGNSSR